MNISTDQNETRAAAAPTVGTFGGGAATVGAVAPPVAAAGHGWGTPPGSVQTPSSVLPKQRTNVVIGVCLALAVGLFAAHSAHAWPFSSHPAAQGPSTSGGTPSGGSSGTPSGNPGGNSGTNPGGSSGSNPGGSSGSNASGNLPLPSDVNRADCGDGSSDAQQNSMGGGLVQALECPEPSLSSGRFDIFAYDNQSDATQALAAFDAGVSFDPSSASQSCPPANGASTGMTQSGSLLVECAAGNSTNLLMIEDTSANVLMIVSTTSDWSTIGSWLSNLQLSQ